MFFILVKFVIVVLCVVRFGLIVLLLLNIVKLLFLRLIVIL